MSTPIGGLGPQRLGNLHLEVRLRLPAQGAPGATPGASFGDALKRALNEVAAQEQGAQAAAPAAGAGAGQGGMALETLVEVRNRLTEAYRAVINMQS